MSFDINNQFSGLLYGQDRIGQTTPDLESSEWLRPWLPVAYPAPYLPTLRQDQGHPKLASIVISAHMLVGQDKNGGLVPAGYFSGTQANGSAQPITNIVQSTTSVTLTITGHKYAVGESFTISSNFTDAGATAAIVAFAGTTQVVTSKATNTVTFTAPTGTISSTAITAGKATSTLGGQYCVIVYSAADVTFAYNPKTAARVAAAGEYAVLAAPADALVGDTITLPNGTVVTVQSGDITFAQSCDLFPTGKARPIGCAVRNVYQYIGGVSVGTNGAATSSATGINYVLDGVVPVNFLILNYMHEMGTAIQTQFALKLPWIGATPTTLTALAAGDSIVGYAQLFGRSFTHFTGARGTAVGQFSFGSGVVASSAGNGSDAGNFAPYNPAIHTPQDLVGHVIAMQNLSPVGFLNRVRTLYDRPMTGPMVDPNSAALRMGGSATGGIPVHISVTTDAIFKMAYDQNKTLHQEYSTHIIVRVNL